MLLLVPYLSPSISKILTLAISCNINVRVFKCKPWLNNSEKSLSFICQGRSILKSILMAFGVCCPINLKSVINGAFKTVLSLNITIIIIIFISEKGRFLMQI